MISAVFYSRTPGISTTWIKLIDICVHIQKYDLCRNIFHTYKFLFVILRLMKIIDIKY